MSTKPQLPGPNPTTAAPPKQSRSRKAANADPSTTGRAGSAGGVMLEKEVAKKPSTPKAATSQTKATKTQDAPKRKPRKLNKEPTPTATATATSTSTSTPKDGTKDGLSNEAAELEALKSRVRGLEAKVEELYQGTASTGAPRSPRRRGKGRKSSSATTTATLGTLAQRKVEEGPAAGEEEEADEELIRLEDELETARHDLALYHPAPSRPRTRRTASGDAEVVEEIPRDRPSVGASDRQVTLSGSYRIPLPASLNPQDVKTIQSGVSAAQNVARSFLDQRRASQALRDARADVGPPPSSSSSSASKAKSAGPARSAEPDNQLGAEAGGKQSWGEWIGGYSMAITRAVKNIEHEAAMEAQTQAQSSRPRSARTGSGTGARRKRPAAKTALSGEQVEGLMS